MHRNEREEHPHGAPRFALITLSLLMAGLITVSACGGGEAPAPEPEPEAEEPMAEAAPMDMEMDMTPRVFFIAPEEGATVGTSVDLVFGAENFAIEPVGDGDIHEGAGHHHVGIDTDCLPAGEIVPEAAPWVHFGDASSTINMQFEPGEHRVCLQIGDGEHRTIEGLSAVVTFTVE
jgi:hypothetical protein